MMLYTLKAQYRKLNDIQIKWKWSKLKWHENGTKITLKIKWYTNDVKMDIKMYTQNSKPHPS